MRLVIDGQTVGETDSANIEPEDEVKFQVRVPLERTEPVPGVGNQPVGSVRLELIYRDAVVARSGWPPS